MSIKCDVCGKKVMHGQRIKHKHSKGWMYRAPNTKRTWKPNLRKVKIDLNTYGLGDGVAEVKMCMACYKRFSQDGIDFLKRKSPRLYKKLLSGKLNK